jgi:hypothetical protein
MSVHYTKLPVPHLEHPKDSASASDSNSFPLRVSFLQHQTVQAAHVVFVTQLSYNFENWDGRPARASLAVCGSTLMV